MRRRAERGYVFSSCVCVFWKGDEHVGEQPRALSVRILDTWYDTTGTQNRFGGRE